uniref:ABC transporter domain-containing protein n=1 Tax=Amazona collaria TaxID=241587 RepID=A0A8B9FXP8_9PSIT
SLGLDPRQMGVDLGTSALLNPNSYFLFSTYIMLVFDSVLYMLLAMYFDKVLPGKYSIPDPPFFCLKPLYWVRSRRGSTRELPRTPVSPEEEDQKSFLPKLDVVFILGLSLNIYEGQITALLGHSGAGKTTLLNVLSGLTFPSEGRMASSGLNSKAVKTSSFTSPHLFL